jgi:tocopherol cyclase
MFKRFYTPGAYHGWGTQRVFFEGWYYKLISLDQNQRMAIIPGIYNHPDPKFRHAFIQILDGMNSHVNYHRYSSEAFQASRNDFYIKVGSSEFHHQGINLDISGEDQSISGELEFKGIQPWPVKLISPGVMGPYRFVPLMQTYHGILSLDHTIQGRLRVDGRDFDFSGGRGYMEKDWGVTFPRAYIWMQSNHFSKKGVSLTASVATIPWLKGWFRGFLIGLLVDGKLYRFTTYLGSEIGKLHVFDNEVYWVTTGTKRTDPEGEFDHYQLTIRAERGSAGLLSSPELDGMTPRIFESLTASIQISLKGYSPKRNIEQVIFEGSGSCGGLEVAGSIEEIVEQKQEIL